MVGWHSAVSTRTILGVKGAGSVDDIFGDHGDRACKFAGDLKVFYVAGTHTSAGATPLFIHGK